MSSYSHLTDDEFGRVAFAQLDPLVESELVIELLERFGALLDAQDEAEAVREACKGASAEQVKEIFDWLDRMPELPD